MTYNVFGGTLSLPQSIYTHCIEVVDHPDFRVVILHVILHKVAIHADVHVFRLLFAVLQGKFIRFLNKQLTIFIYKYFHWARVSKL